MLSPYKYRDCSAGSDIIGKERNPVFSMNKLAPFLTSIVVAVTAVTIAIVASQNTTPASLRFLTFRSIRLPVGTMLAMGTGTGCIVGAIAFSPSRSARWEHNDD